MMAVSLLRVDLVRRHWRSYAFVCIVCLAIHAAWIMRLGFSRSTDFQARYDPGARAMLAAIGVGGVTAPDFSWTGYGATRVGYMSFVAGCYALFGVSLDSVIYPQIAIAWLVYPLMLHLLLHFTERPVLSLGAMCVWLTYLDSYQWQFWGLPDALYRVMFVAAFFVLLRLWETGRETAFVWTTFVATAIGTLFRIETPLYALPAIGLSIRAVNRRSHALLAAGVVAAAAFMLFVGRHIIASILGELLTMEVEGRVLPGSGYDIPGLTSLDHPIDGSAASWALFFAHVAVNRFWYAITPLPALWSRLHRAYYAIYLTAGYALTIAGFLNVRVRSSRNFRLCFWVFTAGVVLQVIVAVDPSMRYGYTPQVFLFFCAVMGWQAMRPMLSPAR